MLADELRLLLLVWRAPPSAARHAARRGALGQTAEDTEVPPLAAREGRRSREGQLAATGELPSERAHSLSRFGVRAGGWRGECEPSDLGERAGRWTSGRGTGSCAMSGPGSASPLRGRSAFAAPPAGRGVLGSPAGRVQALRRTASPRRLPRGRR